MLSGRDVNARPQRKQVDWAIKGLEDQEQSNDYTA